MHPKLQAWLLALRPATLPIGVSPVVLGAGLAWAEGGWRPGITALSLVTALQLQLLSNLGNDYGDGRAGHDPPDRAGPPRALALGRLTAAELRRALGWLTGLTGATGLLLLNLALPRRGAAFVLFLLLGLLAVAAALGYMIGRRPYGHRALGDLAVFLCFGLLGVLGTVYLNLQRLEPLHGLPAAACGLLAVAVLNINNLRDLERDRAAGKRTIAGLLGSRGARRYQWALVLGAGLLAALFLALRGAPWPGWMFLLALPPLLCTTRRVAVAQRPAELNRPLPETVWRGLLFNLLLGVGAMLAAMPPGEDSLHLTGYALMVAVDPPTTTGVALCTSSF